MAKLETTINSFTRGMITPWLKSRIDLDAYNKGALDLTNCLTRPFGGALNRSGFLYVGETKTTGLTRLLPFVFSIEQSFIVEAGIGYFRFWKDGALIESGGSPYEIVNPYSEQEIKELHYAQSRDVLFLAVNGEMPKRLERIADDNWQLVDLDFTGGPFLLENTTSTTITPSATTGTITLTASDPIFESGHVGSLWSINAAKVVGDEPIQGYVKITVFTNSTLVTAEVQSELLNATATDIWAEGAWSDVRGYPRTVTFHQGRLWLANTVTEPQTAWGSEPLVYNNFSLEQGVQIELPSNQYNFITGLSSSRELAAITYGAPFVISGGSTLTAITSDNIQSRQQGSVGGEFIQPLVIGSYTYFMQRGGNKLIQFNYDFDSDGYLNNNISLLSEDLFETGIKEMSLQKNEDNILWLVRNDGKLITLTKEFNQNVESFTIQETDGTFESVASIPNEAQFWDDVYIVVKRTINGVEKQYVELLTQPRNNTLEQGNYLDSSYVYDGRKTSTLSITGGTATSSASDFAATDVGEFIRINDNGTDVDYEITAYTSPTEVTVDTTDVVNTSSWELSKTTFTTGLDHLEAKEVGILRDGAVDPKQTITSGELTLLQPAFYAIIGLSYRSIVEPFPIEGGNRSGSSLGNLKRLAYADLKLIDTMGIQVNAEFEEDVFNRFYDIPMGTPNPLFTGNVRVTIPKDFEKETTLKIVQDSPLPMAITGITLNFSTQEV